MSSRDLIDEVNALFKSYCASFEALDPEAIADHFAYPGIIVSDAEDVVLIALANRQECVAAVAKVVALHRRLGVPVGRVQDLSVLELSPRLVQAFLKMEVLDETASYLYDFDATYSLVRNSGAWRIVAISHNQMPRLLRCVAQRQSDGSREAVPRHLPGCCENPTASS
jgi:hypothetical protein